MKRLSTTGTHRGQVKLRMNAGPVRDQLGKPLINMNINKSKLLSEMVLVAGVSFVLWATKEVKILNNSNYFWLEIISANVQYYFVSAPFILLRIVYKALSINWSLEGSAVPLYGFIVVYVLLIRMFLLYTSKFKWKYFTWFLIIVLCACTNALVLQAWIRKVFPHV